jgi:hypothetical protein
VAAYQFVTTKEIPKRELRVVAEHGEDAAPSVLVTTKEIPKRELRVQPLKVVPAVAPQLDEVTTKEIPKRELRVQLLGLED